MSWILKDFIFVRNAGEQVRGTPYHALYDLGGRRNIGNQVNDLTCNHSSRVEVPRGTRRRVSRQLFLLVLEQVSLTTAPFLGKIVLQYAAQ